jgi:MoaA/NifB/PqqE/SkfB family radical SAM enzyme
MKLPQDKFCVLPWISLEASPIGTVRPCCLAEDEIIDNDGNKFELTKADFVEIRNSDYMKNLRQQFLTGQKPNTCKKCWNEEDSGRTSKRMHTIDRLKHIVGNQSWSEDEKPMMFLDLKLGNICNLKCRICGSWSSSSYATEEMMAVPHQDRKKTFAYQMLRAGSWPRENKQFWQQIDQCLSDIHYIEFTGGEPFMISEHFDMLQGIIDRGIAGQVEIHYNTNGTIVPERAPDIWRHFKTVEVAFSIDDVGPRFEYQRMNASWKEVNENINKFKLLQSTMPNLQLQCCSTVNVFNVLYLEELAAWHKLASFDFIYWNMLHEAYYFSIGSLPELSKQYVKQKLESTATLGNTKQEFEKIIQFMMQGTSLDGSLLREKIKEIDLRRSQDLNQHHSELAKTIAYE